MATLSYTQRTILCAAATRDDLRALPLPDTLRAPPHIVKKTVTALIEAGLLAEITALPVDAIWVESEAGGRVALVVTPAGLVAIGIEPEAAPVGVAPDESPTSRKLRGGIKAATGSNAASGGSTGDARVKTSKQDLTLALLRRPEGASVAEMMAATGWQPHSVRGFLTGVAKKRLGLEVTSGKSDGGERRYYVAAKAEDNAHAAATGREGGLTARRAVDGAVPPASNRRFVAPYSGHQ